MNWWQRIVAFLLWPAVFAAVCGFWLVAGFAIWIAIPFAFGPEEMSDERYQELMDCDLCNLTAQEIEAGWHWCNDFDGLLVGPGMDEQKYCHCDED